MSDSLNSNPSKPAVPSVKSYVTETMELLEREQAYVCELIDYDYRQFLRSTDWSVVLEPKEHHEMVKPKTTKSEPLISLLIKKFKEDSSKGKAIVDTLKKAAKGSKNSLLEYLLDHEKRESGSSTLLKHKLNMFFTFVHLNWDDFTEMVAIDKQLLVVLKDRGCITVERVHEIDSYEFESDKQASLLVDLLQTQEDWYPNLLYALCATKREDYLKKCHEDILLSLKRESHNPHLPFSEIKTRVERWFQVNIQFGSKKPMESMSTDGEGVVTSDKMDVEMGESKLTCQSTAQLLNTTNVTVMEVHSEQILQDGPGSKEMQINSDKEDEEEIEDSKMMDDAEETPAETSQPISTSITNPPTISTPAPVLSSGDNQPSTSSSHAKCISSKASSSSRSEPEDYASDENDMADLLGIGTMVAETPHTAAPAPERKILELREYQRALAEDACNNHNVIIVAPTNSGKTHVAMYIAQNHLHRDPKNRVLFIVHRVNLVDQQYKQFVDYFPSKEVEKMSGGRNLRPLATAVKDKKIVVLTVDILRNALECEDSNDRFYLTHASLLIFDECHNCMKDHPYNAIMDFYFEESETVKFSTCKPQIVGLTASPGTGKAEMQSEAFDHLLKLCANLDCKRIAYKSDEDVLKFMQENDISKEKLDVQVIPADVRRIKWLDGQLQSIMKVMEVALQRLKQTSKISSDCGSLLNIPSDKRGSSEYTNFIGKLAKIVKFIKPDDTATRIVVECLRSLLDILNGSLQVYLLFRDEDAVRFLEESLPAENVKPVHEVERRLLNRIRTEVIALSPNHTEENPCLQQLKKVVLDQVMKEPDSRILVFVKERLFTTLLVEAFTNDPEMKHIPVGAIVGAQNDTNTIRSTQNLEREMLAKFRSGDIKVLFSTSVTEEGLDIVKCNLVVRYVHVTNEIAMVQSRGRARAGYSKYVLIYHEEEAWISNKEVVNKNRHDMMIKAVETFDKYRTDGNSAEIDKIIDEIIHEKKLRCARKKQANESSNGSRTTTEYQFQCKKCQQVATSSRHIRKRNTHYFCLDPTVKERCVMEPNSETDDDLETIGKLMCGKCKTHQWGVQCIFSERVFIVLKIKNFNLFPDLEDGALGTCELCSQWSRAPFHVPNLDLTQF